MTFDESIQIFRDLRRDASHIHADHCANVRDFGLFCDCGEPDRQRKMLDAMRNTAAALNSGEPAEVALRKLLWGLTDNESTRRTT